MPRSVRFDQLPAHLQRLVRKHAPDAAGVATKPAKYRSRIAIDPRTGVVYESELERDVPAQLEFMLRDGQIARWSWGPRFVLTRDPTRPHTLITYRPDFVVWPTTEGFMMPDGSTCRDWFVLDAKGVGTAVFNNKVRQWKVDYPRHPLLLVRKGNVWTLA